LPSSTCRPTSTPAPRAANATCIPDCLHALAEVAAGLHAHYDAARLFAAAGRARAEITVVRTPPEEEHWAAIDSRLREALGDDAYRAARAHDLPGGRRRRRFPIMHSESECATTGETSD
jgi:hypothetical protein